MFNIILHQPEIPPNTGNIIRLCANTGATLHLIKPLGFTLEDKQMKRAGLDYHEWATVKIYDGLEDCLSQFQAERIFALTTKAKTRYDAPQFKADDAFIFGPETRGLSSEILARFAEENRLRIPMQAAGRSLNLSNAASVMLYEAWRQNDFTN